MRFEDPILKEDGTLITWIDIRLLKLSKIVAYPFMGADDETYTPAFRRMLRFSGHYFSLMAIYFGYANDWPLAILSVLFGFSISFVTVISKIKCNGYGTIQESQGDKISYLIILAAIPFLFAFGSYGTALEVAPGNIPLAIEGLVLLGLEFLVLTYYYVRRLGEPPPKRKKARVFKPAHSHH